VPNIEREDRWQKAVLMQAVRRGAASYDDFGQPIIYPPEELDVRWIWKQTTMTGSQGMPVSVHATVVVDREIELGSKMWLGNLADWLGTGSGSSLESDNPDDSLMEVVAIAITPDLKGRSQRITLGLAYARGEKYAENA